MHVNVAKELAVLKAMTVAKLRAQYAQVFGEETHIGSKTLLVKRIIWGLQASAEGDLSERARRRAAQLANDSDLRLRAPRSFWGEVERNGEPPNRDPRLPPAGTVLERVYQGQIIRVTVLANGFEYHGKHYASLSAIAHRVTGTRWNGFHFFGLKQEWKHE